ncbi:hypothetical protein [Streptococcus mitis]|uniref:Lipoprotein n=1 Tax=Streptococcus mitis TaxID=28037 RepID=A0A4U1LBI8_STRMT|nr:hypothetical protein [Streptococcus mitis]MDU7139088.1 hypothetical protein [Streptococcus mitis]TKD53840.1 hypothetical protein FBF73_00305 [Streptococcus mitis]
MMKSIRVLLLLAVVQILFGSCLLWKETFLSLRQVNVYFLILIVGISGFCAGINYFHTSGQKRHSILHSQKKVWMVYTILLVVNLLASCLVLSESIQIHNKLQQDLVDLFLPSFFFLLGIDMWIFLPFDKYHRDLENLLNRKKTGLLSILATVIFLRNPLTISSILVYIVLGFLCARFIFPKSIQREISFYGHIIRDILFVISMFVFF